MDRQDLSTRKNKVLWGDVIFVVGRLMVDDYGKGLLIVITLPPSMDTAKYGDHRS